MDIVTLEGARGGTKEQYKTVTKPVVGGVAKKWYRTLTLGSCGSPGTSGSWRGHAGSGANGEYKTLTKDLVDNLASVTRA